MRLLKLLALVTTVLALAAPASAQFASRFSWGPTVPMFKISLEDSTDARTDFLTAGAGMFFAANLAPSADGRWRMITFALPVFINYADGFGLDFGLTVGTLNNLISAGIGTGIVRDGDGVSEVFSRENTYVLISASLNFGPGAPGNDAMVSKAAAAGTYGRPPGYVGW